jgi:outer membrane protein insertion porin family
MRTGWARVGVILWLAIMGWGGWAQAPAVPHIRETRVDGLAQTPPAVQAQVRALVAALDGQAATAEQVGGLREAISELGWFLRVGAETEPLPEGVRLVVTVEENPLIRAVAFRGNTVLAEARLRDLVAPLLGQVLNREQVVERARAIGAAYARAGVPLAEVVDIAITPEGTLTFVIREPRIQEVRIEGNTRTRATIIRRSLTIAPGQIYQEAGVRESLGNLERLGVFDEVSATPEPGAAPGQVIVLFRVKERRTGFANVGTTYSQVGGWSGFIDVAEANLFGTAQRANLRLQFGATSAFGLSYFNPALDARRTTLGVNLYNRQLPRQVIVGPDEIEYEEDRSGGNLTVGRPIARATQLFLTLRADQLRGQPDEDPNVPALLLEEATVRSLAVSAVRDTRAPFLFPVQGSYATARLEGAGLLGGVAFTKLDGEMRRYWIVRTPRSTPARPRLPWVLASRALIGTSTGDPPLLDQFRVGGTETLRGFREDRFPGTNQFVVNTELRVPITTALQLVGFLDTGDAWGGRFARAFGDPEFEMHTGYGVGLRVSTPIGPLRLDYALAGEDEVKFHFGIGPTF